MTASPSDPRPKRRRRRGVILTPTGFEKLQQAKVDAEYADNGGNRYTLEDLSERTQLAVDTLMKVFACETKVDKQTLKFCFRAFQLELAPQDYRYPDDEVDGALNSSGENTQSAIATLSTPEMFVDPDPPGGQVPIASSFYIPATELESQSSKAVLQPGGLVRIKAPRRMGKTSLMSRILRSAEEQGCRTVALSFQLADKDIFQDLNLFLQWFCANVGLGLQLPNQLDEYWDDLFGSKISCKIYFEQYLLTRIHQPLVLALDDVDRLFSYPELADEFFGLLRAWHEEAKNRDVWKRLRLIVAHSTEVYIPLNINKSPFNVGLPIELAPWSTAEVVDLLDRYDLDWSDHMIQTMMGWVAGYPYLVQVAAYESWKQNLNFLELLQPERLDLGIYGDHLQRQQWSLQQVPNLYERFCQVAQADAPVELDFELAFQLQSLGLVHLQGHHATPSCQLYADYFRERAVI